MAPNISTKLYHHGGGGEGGESAENFVRDLQAGGAGGAGDNDQPVMVAMRDLDHEPTEHRIQQLPWTYMHVQLARALADDADDETNREAVLKAVGRAVEILFGEVGRSTLALDVIRAQGHNALLRVPLQSTVAVRCALTTCASDDEVTLLRVSSNAHTLCVNSERFKHC